MPHDPKVIPIMRGRLVLVAERYGTPRVLVTSAVRASGTRPRPAQTAPTRSRSCGCTLTACSASWPTSASRTWTAASSPCAHSSWSRGSGWC